MPVLACELQIRHRGTYPRRDQHHGTAKQLADRLTKIVLYVGPGLRIADHEPQTIHLSLR